MKPRLDSAEFTEEDKAIWLRICEGEPFDHLACAALYATADRRDADLMLVAQSQRYSDVRLTDGQVYADRSRFPVPYLAPISQPDVGPVGGDITNCA